MMYLSSGSVALNSLFCLWSCHGISHADKRPQFQLHRAHPDATTSHTSHDLLLPDSQKISQRSPLLCPLYLPPCPPQHPFQSLTIQGHYQDHGSHLGAYPMQVLYHFQSIIAKLVQTLPPAPVSVYVAFKALYRLLSILISFFPSLRTLFPLTELVVIWREGWCSGLGTHRQRRTFIVVWVLPLITQ